MHSNKWNKDHENIKVKVTWWKFHILNDSIKNSMT